MGFRIVVVILPCEPPGAPTGRNQLRNNPAAIITGTNGPNTITGTGSAGTINALGGNDTVYARGGNDTVLGGLGDDLPYGEAGDDLIRGEDGRDRVSGGTGNDRISGGNQDDRLWGDAGNDRIWGDAGNDQLYGGAGNDQLYGGDGNDRLYDDGGTGPGRTTSGNDQFYGGAGADTFHWNVLSISDGFVAYDGDYAGRDVVADFTRGQDKLRLRVGGVDDEFGGFDSSSFLDFDTNSNGRIDAGDEGWSVQNATLNGVTKASLVLNADGVGYAAGTSSTLTIFGVTTLTAADFV